MGWFVTLLLTIKLSNNNSSELYIRFILWLIFKVSEERWKNA